MVQILLHMGDQPDVHVISAWTIHFQIWCISVILPNLQEKSSRDLTYFLLCLHSVEETELSGGTDSSWRELRSRPLSVLLVSLVLPSIGLTLPSFFKLNKDLMPLKFDQENAWLQSLSPAQWFRKVLFLAYNQRLIKNVWWCGGGMQNNVTSLKQKLSPKNKDLLSITLALWKMCGGLRKNEMLLPNRWCG